MEELNEITQHLLRFSPDALIVIDDRGLIRFANETVAQLFGHRPEALVGKSVDSLVPERFRGRHGQHVGGFLNHPNNREMGARIADLFALRADGSEFSAGIRLAPFRIGDRLFVAAAIRDMTERRRINEELVAARVEADRANRAKSRFLATASHDLRQPMQTIRLLNAALLKTVPEESSKYLLEQQGQAIESMTRLLNALLDISRLESGSIEPVKGDVRLTEVFEELRSSFASVAQTRGIQLHIDVSDIVLTTDRTLFQQLLENLLGNALKYTDAGRVGLTAGRDGEGVTIVVEDTGIGIPADKLERIFDEYYQVDTHGTKRMGVGLGLAIVKEVARLLGFQVRVSSKVGEGTQARIHIPSHSVSRGYAASTEARAAGTVSGGAHKPRLMLVEDNDGVRTATALFLRLEGHETLCAASAAEAEKLFEGIEPGDVVIADYHLDVNHTGLELLLRLRERLGRDVPGVVLSGDLPSLLRSIRAPIPNCRFLGKPVDTNALMAAIEELTG
ncbi:PAS domain S-box-containing protein [Povalibacter uvarum]|uniref:histidine kinase n=1 Tax=Povalibacter uvarum TaxID=732238 RepID=A0A841HIK6_9GAMM|nr:ATP-binding protein [Povalibacter uvarum]MBB6092130.1 PAS domain S-box-containing protein [Povalibacter uvarum]